jgi:hypothetical protein
MTKIIAKGLAGWFVVVYLSISLLVVCCCLTGLQAPASACKFWHFQQLVPHRRHAPLHGMQKTFAWSQGLKRGHMQYTFTQAPARHIRDDVFRAES